MLQKKGLLPPRSMPPSMTYDIVPHPKKEGRHRVINAGTGKVWKTDYGSVEAARKAIAYIEGRFGGDGSSPSSTPASTPSSNLDDDPDTSKERAALGIPPKVTPDEDTEGW